MMTRKEAAISTCPYSLGTIRTEIITCMVELCPKWRDEDPVSSCFNENCHAERETVKDFSKCRNCENRLGYCG